MLAYDISHWLSRGAPFGEGVQLYVLAFPTRREVRTFQAELSNPFVSPGVYRRLVDELRVLAKADPRKAAQESAEAELEARERDLDDREEAMEEAIEEGVEERASQRLAREAEPDAILALRRKAKPLHARFNALRAELRHADSDAARYTIAHELMSKVSPAIDAIYSQIRAFAKTGEAPPHPDLERFRGSVSADCFEYIRLHHLAKRKTVTLTAAQQARLVELRPLYNKHREASYAKHP